jgi:hypothetical protein
MYGPAQPHVTRDSLIACLAEPPGIKLMRKLVWDTYRVGLTDDELRTLLADVTGGVMPLPFEVR